MRNETKVAESTQALGQFSDLLLISIFLIGLTLVA
jgi:hypothetical protein